MNTVVLAKARTLVRGYGETDACGPVGPQRLSQGTVARVTDLQGKESRRLNNKACVVQRYNGSKAPAREYGPIAQRVKFRGQTALRGPCRCFRSSTTQSPTMQSTVVI